MSRVIMLAAMVAASATLMTAQQVFRAGIDLVHFGVVVVVNLMIGLITPPYGLLLFVVASVARTPLLPVIRDVLPFLVAMICALALITWLPGLVLWLPRLLGYGG